MSRSLELQNQTLQINPLIKIRFPSYLTSNKWTIEEKLRKIRYSMPFPAILIAVICIKPTRRADLLDILLQNIDIDVSVIENLIDSLILNNLIFTGNSESLQLAQSKSSLLNSWKERGWGEAGDYHWFTWDFPFLDYSKDGGKRSLALMAAYHRQEPDVQRVKTYENNSHKIELPYPTSLIGGLNEERLLSLETFFGLMSLAFAKKTNSPCPWSTVPLIRRTSPSGGCRHPTEGYVLNRSISGLNPGWYHIQADPPSLVCLDRDLNPEEFAFTFPAFQDKRWAATVVLTSVFERNMYRYREARTFRSIHIDVGHILSTIEMISEKQNLATQVTYNFCEKSILKSLNAHQLEEGIMACIAIGTGRFKDEKS